MPSATMRPPIILAYHGLGSYPRSLDPHNLMVPPELFRRQMDTLRRRGYRFVRLREFVDLLTKGTLERGVCALTFDDGTADNLDILAPLLTELVLPATVFVCPDLLGEFHFAMPAEAEVRLMDAAELRELAASPLIEIGSHTNTHVDLSEASADEAYREMSSSKEALEVLLGQPVGAFAYPKCGYSPVCPDAARRAGYTAAVACGGLGRRNPFELGRESIDPLDGRVGFALKSRRLFWPLRESLPGRFARSTIRPLRYSAGTAD